MRLWRWLRSQFRWVKCPVTTLESSRQRIGFWLYRNPEIYGGGWVATKYPSYWGLHFLTEDDEVYLTPDIIDSVDVKVWKNQYAVGRVVTLRLRPEKIERRPQVVDLDYESDHKSEKRPTPEFSQPSRAQLAKQGLVALMLDSSEYVKPVQEFWLSHRRDEADSDPYDKVIDQALILFKEQGKIDEGELLRRLEAEGCAHLLSRVLLGDPVPENRDKALQQYCWQIRYYEMQRRIALQLKQLGGGRASETQDKRIAEWIEKEYKLEREHYRYI